jgi:hypothetical protein
MWKLVEAAEADRSECRGSQNLRRDLAANDAIRSYRTGAICDFAPKPSWRDSCHYSLLEERWANEERPIAH